MKRIARAALTLVLTCGLCVQLSAQHALPTASSPLVLSDAGREAPAPSTAAVPDGSHQTVREQRWGNPPAAVRQPGSKTRLITAIAFVAGFAVLGLTLRDGR